MAQLVLHDDEYRQIMTVCDRLCREANSRAVFLIDKNGQLMAASGDTENLDGTSMAALVAGEIAATGGLAQLMGEKEFSTLFHEGVSDNLHLSIVASRVILVVIFDSRSSLGLIRLRVKKCAEALTQIFEAMDERSKESRIKSPFAGITEDDIDNLFSV
jgi:predicted regulator of Ras-like GTPase activity (Roadblock/LC7/MglB family)